MLISNNRGPSLKEFVNLINRTLDFMNEEVQVSPERARYYRSRNGAKLEEDVYEVLCVQALGTPFENTIELVSNRSFPDIVAAKYYGVEVKTSKKGWKSIGSSIMESSRIQDIDHICLFFGKLDRDVEFRARPYDQCLSDIVVTHSPRYSIDMELSPGITIFDKMEMHYEDFRNLDAPIDVVKEYYRSMLKPGQELWWMTNNEQALSPVVRLWNTVSPAERKTLQVKGFCWFPEIFGKSPSKYNRFALWLTTENGIVPPALRDMFSSGGKGNVYTREEIFRDQPQVMVQLASSKSLVWNEIIDADKEWVREVWGVDHVYNGENRVRQWINMVGEYRNVERILLALFDLDN